MMRRLSENIWLLPYRLSTLGVNIGRNVTVFRLRSGQLVIHSTAPFTELDVAEVRKLGEPGWLVEGMVDHDTFSEAGRKAFPKIPFLAPAGFQVRVNFEVGRLDAPPPEWSPELEVIRIEGASKMAECALFHHPSGTLVVCDLLFHFPQPPSIWAKILLTMALGREVAPGFSRRLRMAIDDERAFGASLEKVLALPIQRIVPGHGDVLENDAKEKAIRLFANAGFV